MTNADWDKVKEKLKIVGLGHAKLKIDGYIVDLYLRQTSMFNNAIAVYINGELSIKWLDKDCEERKRFICCKRKTLITQKDIKAFGLKSKKRIQEFKDKYAYHEYRSYWENFNAMKKHFEENNESIELLEAEI